MPNILILFAHPRLEKSRANKSMIHEISNVPGITFRDLYELYPDFNIDIEAEKTLLSQHDIIVWHHPVFWYSCPPLLKQWIDMVLEFGWAYGPGGNNLEGKIIFNAITTGGAQEAYSATGHNRYTVLQFLAPFDQTATLCKMIYLPPFLIQGTHRLSQQALIEQTTHYRLLLEKLLVGDFDIGHAKKFTSLNQILQPINTNNNGE